MSKHSAFISLYHLCSPPPKPAFPALCQSVPENPQSISPIVLGESYTHLTRSEKGLAKGKLMTTHLKSLLEIIVFCPSTEKLITPRVGGEIQINKLKQNGQKACTKSIYFLYFFFLAGPLSWFSLLHPSAPSPSTHIF